ncbi:ECF RNA polymerase sigma factor SigE [Gemmata obscuriglobus]|uniref:RNA polymerase sigma factor n=1 Tax=Gemmata obscuriglobus TaxID=114 RepID=A0A2Z3H0H5_9BACT|nr:MULTISPECIES: RNA polymerase sigma factor [Gemmata]AWM39513.1 RNA polymerase sigma factor [Gemmata obscuriglobus]MDY3551324.1 RNA polymerase sigma factor [Gemmata algarum]QEG27397.1 ECF RNA polymerase sigma factor SigE [Gemmata obscuriglobus]VTS04309.1 rna polymerase sigma factor : RNA polymerase sigma-E factor OS=Blastopirellula marina DSM 3645 GN=DSM3645_12941 PE=4 SV=1: Sigma70_r2: Sigma70_r4_2 [Gemmata obscuriglobus UQM 2246]
MAKPGAPPITQPLAGTEPAPDAIPLGSLPDPDATRPGDDALVATFNQVRDELVSTLMYLLGNSDDAQDAAQEAFLKCWRARDSVPDVQNLRAWIFRVALNAAKDFQRSAWNRKSRPLPEDDLMLPARGDAPGQAAEEQEALDRLRRAITQLRQDEKEVFLLRQNGDLTYEQIAEIRCAPVGTVKTQMRTALIKLRKVLNPHAAEDEPCS